MRPQFRQKVMINQTSVTAAATATGRVDTLGYDWCTIDLCATTVAAATNNPSVLKLQESDDTVATNFADISGTVGDTDFTIPNAETAATNEPWGVKFNIDLRGRKRYIDLLFSPLATQNVCVIANLGLGDESPVNTTSANVKVLIEI